MTSRILNSFINTLWSSGSPVLQNLRAWFWFWIHVSRSMAMKTWNKCKLLQHLFPKLAARRNQWCLESVNCLKHFNGLLGHQIVDNHLDNEFFSCFITDCATKTIEKTYSSPSASHQNASGSSFAIPMAYQWTGNMDLLDSMKPRHGIKHWIYKKHQESKCMNVLLTTVQKLISFPSGCLDFPACLDLMSRQLGALKEPSDLACHQVSRCNRLV